MNGADLALKVALTPALIGVASLAGRRWGSAVSGWFVGLPFTSGPVAFLLALDHGPHFAGDVATGTLAGTISQAAFSLGYAWLSLRRSWPAALLVGCVAFGTSTAVLQALPLALPATTIAVVVCLLLAIRLMPSASPARGSGSALPKWDIPARMVVATAFVLAITALAPLLGARLSGLVAPFPLYAATLTVFAHRLQGAEAADSVLRGLLVGLFSFAAFFLALAASVERIGIGPAFLAAVAIVLAVQGASLRALRRGESGPCREGLRKEQPEG